MSYNNLSEIDFEAIWRSQIRPFAHAGRPEAAIYWDRRAATFNNRHKKSSYARDLLARMSLEPDYSMLDIGCGSGSTTIPVAKWVEKVTALDLSPEMLRILEQNIERTRTSNITIVNKSWDEVRPGIDIERHDVVLASRCLSGANLEDALRKMDACARKSCYITWRAERNDVFKASIHEVAGKEHFLYPEYPVILNALYKLGIYANLEHFESIYEETYTDIEEAVRNLAQGEKLNSRTEESLSVFINSYYNRQNGGYYRKSTVRWVLIWWHKQ